jgi:hypothetical protein
MMQPVTSMRARLAPRGLLARNPLRVIQTLLTGLLCTVLAGCVSHQPYPKEWAPIEVAGEGCPDISGTFSDRNEPDPVETDGSRDFSGNAVLLSASLAPEFGTGRPAHHVTITQPHADEIIVGVWRERVRFKNESFTKEIEFSGQKVLRQSDGDFTCKDRAVVLTESGCIGPAEQVTLACESHSLDLKKAEDGSLIIKDHSGGFGIVLLVIPVAASGSNWLLFKQIPPDEIRPE